MVLEPLSALAFGRNSDEKDQKINERDVRLTPPLETLSLEKED